MKTALYGRIVFGASAVLFGVIALRWHDVYTWQSMHSLWNLPFGAAIGAVLMAAQIAGGIGVIYPRTARTAAIVLAVVYAIFALACVPGIVRAPAAQYDSFFEQLSLLCGAIAIYAVTQTDGARRATLGRAARLGIGICAVSFAATQAIYFSETVKLVPTWIPPNQTFWAALTTVAFALAAIAALVNYRARLALRLMALMTGLFGLLVWIPLLIAHPESHFSWSEFALTVLITGAALTVADTI
jgi:uncharacterized membrane protein YphA (DoxX/SURF4 family)